MLRISLLVCAVLLHSHSTGAQTKIINFDNDAVGKTPAGFSFGLTGKGKESLIRSGIPMDTGPASQHDSA